MKRAFRTSITLVVAGLLAAFSAHGQTMGDYDEAPMLAEMVEAGTLPPVAERVSEEPLVREVFGEIGQYGGTLRRWGPDPVGGWIQLNYYRGLGDAGGFGFIIPYDLAGYLNDGLHFGGLDPLYATEYQFNDDFTELTVWHRRGIKWSDGHPLTSDDIIWSMEEVGNDVNIHPNGTWWSHSGGEPIKVEKIDDYTVKYISAVPNPDLTLNVSGPWALYPKHYAEQFHPKFNSDSTYEAFKNNTELRFMDDPGSMPQIGPWVVTQLDSVDGAFATRNPYYPVVDTEGNQLPYIDNIHIRILADQQVAALAVIQGQIDVQGRGMQGFQNFQVMKEGEAEGDYQVLTWKGGAFQGYLKLFFQLNDENLAKMMYEVDFRRALSLAINRDEINEALFFGLAQPSGTMVGQDSPFYDSRMEAYGRYDPDEAKRIFRRARPRGHRRRRHPAVSRRPERDHHHRHAHRPVRQYPADGIGGPAVAGHGDRRDPQRRQALGHLREDAGLRRPGGHALGAVPAGFAAVGVSFRRLQPGLPDTWHQVREPAAGVPGRLGAGAGVDLRHRPGDVLGAHQGAVDQGSRGSDELDRDHLRLSGRDHPPQPDRQPCRTWRPPRRWSTRPIPTSSTSSMRCSK